MTDDVTLRTCPCCGGKAVRVAAPKPNDPRGWVYHALRCENYCLVTTWQCTPEKAAEIWNTRVSDPRVAALEAQLADARDCIDLFNRMIVRAECKWKEAHPDSAFYPDVPDLIVWLKEQVDTLAARRCETCRHRIGISALGTNICAVFGMMSCYIRGCDYWEAKPIRNCGNCLYWHAVPIDVGQGRCALLPEQAGTMYCTDACNKHEPKETNNA